MNTGSTVDSEIKIALRDRRQFVTEPVVENRWPIFQANILSVYNSSSLHLSIKEENKLLRECLRFNMEDAHDMVNNVLLEGVNISKWRIMNEYKRSKNLEIHPEGNDFYNTNHDGTDKSNNKTNIYEFLNSVSPTSYVKEKGEMKGIPTTKPSLVIINLMKELEKIEGSLFGNYKSVKFVIRALAKVWTEYNSLVLPTLQQVFSPLLFDFKNALIKEFGFTIDVETEALCFFKNEIVIPLLPAIEGKWKIL
ncbi:hypothetical protein BB559_003352 [Furculomyces boomerangus]|uniref:Uncharacterized protein n=2 Tax=Harpellales TaxID=61421 RepID=A0A2T9YLT6_9FUNG|nr:hypothetical protein BB559_003352 [Furculomyces boomerangus]PWA00431.1 hypothetical protein BB558_003507 [Smittium angustum]